MATPSPQLAALLLRIGDLTGQAARPGSLGEELSRAAAGVRQLLGAAACSVALVEDDESTLRFVAADGAGSDAIIGVSLPINRGIAGWVAMSGQGIAVADVASDSRFARDVAEATSYVPASILAVPVVEPQGAVLGVLEVLDPELAGMDTGTALNVLGTVGGQIAAVIRLSGTFDHLGRALLEAAGQGGDTESFGAALRELATDTDDSGERELIALAETLNDMAALGPETAALARRILSDVAEVARARR